MTISDFSVEGTASVKDEMGGDNWFAKYAAGLGKVITDKQKMVARKLMRAKANCPVCEGKDTMQLGLAPNRRDKSGYHVRWACSCGFQGME